MVKVLRTQAPSFGVTANTLRSMASSVCVGGPLQFRNELASNACYSCSLVSIPVQQFLCWTHLAGLLAQNRPKLRKWKPKLHRR